MCAGIALAMVAEVNRRMEAAEIAAATPTQPPSSASLQ